MLLTFLPRKTKYQESENYFWMTLIQPVKKPQLYVKKSSFCHGVTEAKSCRVEGQPIVWECHPSGQNKGETRHPDQSKPSLLFGAGIFLLQQVKQTWARGINMTCKPDMKGRFFSHCHKYNLSSITLMFTGRTSH